MSRSRVILITIGILLSMFLASMEATVVATAMPTIVGQLGGLEHYSWVFSVYMLTSTTVIPLYGKLSDIYGRRKIYVTAMTFFLAGSAFCGLSMNMTQLIAARALQGLGAGGVQPMAFILIGEMFDLKQRAKMQGFFSGIWGLSSIVGPLLGGFLVDQFSWRWVFYINVAPGLLAAALVALAWRECASIRESPAVDYHGAALLTLSVALLLFGLLDAGALAGWLLIGAAVVLFAALLWVENRAADPVLPIHLFRERLFSTAVAHGVFAGWAMFGSVSFNPLFVQSVMGTSAMRAGVTITPMLLGWVGASVVGMRLILKAGHRRLGVTGTATLTAGAFLMTFIGAESSQAVMMVYIGMMGVGMGLSIPSFLVAVQTSVERRHLGAATSTVQFSRSIGGALGVSVMGAALSARLASNLSAANLDPRLVSQLLDPLPGAKVVVETAARFALADAIHVVFVIALIAPRFGLGAGLF
jgi:EmrB/QacA subfamily drug resistance transporter